MSASLSRLTPSRQAQLGCSAERVSPARKQAHQPRASHAGRRPCGMRRSGRMAQLSGTQTAAPNCIAREASPAARAEPAQASVPSRALEAALWARGFNVVVGVDEAGRGPLAGPVLACAFSVSPDACIPGVRDSKQLSAAQRTAAYARLTAHSGVVWATAAVDVETIDRINILQATLLAMERAVRALPTCAEYVLVDGNRVPEGLGQSVPCEAVVAGDRHSHVIAAASIIAKVERDLLMDAYDKEHPQYGFRQHKGYGTAAHMRAIEAHGPCRVHRMSFAPMKHMGA